MNRMTSALIICIAWLVHCYQHLSRENCYTWDTASTCHCRLQLIDRCKSDIWRAERYRVYYVEINITRIVRQTAPKFFAPRSCCCPEGTQTLVASRAVIISFIFQSYWCSIHGGYNFRVPTHLDRSQNCRNCHAGDITFDHVYRPTVWRSQPKRNHKTDLKMAVI